MSFGLYKPGQGYWVRVMTAAAIAILTFATAGWLMGQMSVLADKLPVRTWIAEVQNNATPEPVAGQRVKLLTSGGSGIPEVLGTAEVLSFERNSSTIRVGSFLPVKEGFDPTSGLTFAKADDGSGFVGSVKGNIRKLPPIRAQYLQLGAALVVLLLGATVAYLFAGARSGSVEFLIATDMEMKKVNWSTRRDIMTSTWVVVGAAFLLAGVLFGIDLVFQYVFKLIGVLE